MPLSAASASPEWTSPSARRRSREKPSGVSTSISAQAMPRVIARPLALQHAAADLIELDRLKQSLEIALAKTLVALALDDLEEDRPNDRRREYLQEHLVLGRRTVEKYSILLQPHGVLSVIRQPGREHIVVRVGRILEGYVAP